MYEELNMLLRHLDTGILRLGAEDTGEMDLDEIKDKKNYLMFLEILTGDRYFISEKEGKETTKKLIAFHKCDDGTEIRFDIDKESDGTRRLLDILPAFTAGWQLNLRKTRVSKIYFIDELDRSLHHLLLRKLLNKYFASCNADSRTQILFTTHDLLLMDQNLFRRDEMNVVERDATGASSVIPLNEYNGIRSDKDLLKSYLQGRFGGIPRL
jgi:AAA15 family ATPase/GTPase